jgi:radical SAM protein with 4Fe4S-binding SPASM domain
VTRLSGLPDHGGYAVGFHVAGKLIRAMTAVIDPGRALRHAVGMRPPIDVTRLDFNRAPFLVIWEVTRACALACVHCRADAMHRRDPAELTTEEAFRLIDEIHRFESGPPLLVLTGGDPMRRPDLTDLVRHAAQSGLVVALTPSGTAAATRKRLEELQAAGLSRLAVSLDGPDPETHDRFRGVRGSYDWTIRTLPNLEAMARRVGEFPLTLWALFFLVQTGRGVSLEQINADECERVLTFLYDLSLTAPFGIKTTEAPQFQRVIWQRERHRAETGDAESAAVRRRQLRAPRSVNDGNGFVFVDHVGKICPSGFLPAVCGNVRTDSLVSVYQTHEMFRRLRNAGELTGKCGRCEFREICGGSRARSFAATGAVMASDPLCVYEPGATVAALVTA